jgi:hypothetical protein
MRSIPRKRKCRAPAVTIAPARSSAGFTARISGDVHATMGGDATFTAVPAPESASPVFRLLLGPLSAQGCVLLTWTSGSLRARRDLFDWQWGRPRTASEGRCCWGPSSAPSPSSEWSPGRSGFSRPATVV